jgi:hypothetical protein
MRFYVVERRVRKHPPFDDALTDAASSPDRISLGKRSLCTRCRKPVGWGEWLPPFSVSIDTWGRKFGDLVEVISSNEMLASERFRHVYQASGLVGLSGFEPVKIDQIWRYRDLAGMAPPYFRAKPALSIAAIDSVASECEWKEPPSCELCREGDIKRWQRIIFEPKSWSGEDIFYSRGLPYALMASERFKEFCEANGIRNVTFLPAESYGCDFCPWEPQSRTHKLPWDQ